jgi:uncharacterized membrane protein
MIFKLTLALLYALLNATGASMIKHNLIGQSLNSIQDYVRILLNFKIISGFWIIFLSVLAMFKLLTISKLSFAVPVSTAMNFGITILYSLFLFNEKPNWSTFFGATLIIAGIIIYSLNKSA